jgi:hypothetical protein
LFEPLPLALQRQLQGLCQHLVLRGEGVHLTDKSRLAERLGHTLRGRARLAPSEPELEAIAEYLSNNREVAQLVPTLLNELQPLLNAPSSSL